MFWQGIATAPIQLASVYQAIANGGSRSPASLIESCTTPSGGVSTLQSGAETTVAYPETATALLHMMDNVVTDYGDPDCPIAGYRVDARTVIVEYDIPPSLPADFDLALERPQSEVQR